MTDFLIITLISITIIIPYIFLFEESKNNQKSTIWEIKLAHYNTSIASILPAHGWTHQADLYVSLTRSCHRVAQALSLLHSAASAIEAHHPVGTGEGDEDE